MVQKRVISSAPALRWEDAMVSGNGATGIMVMGRPLDELIIVNHEKLWVVKAKNRPQVPDLRDAWRRARELAFDGRYRDAMALVDEEKRRALAPLLDAEGEPRPHRFPYDHIHPGLHLHIESESFGPIEDYRRQTILDSGEITVGWTDTKGSWERRAFVSRVDDIIVIDIRPPTGENLTCRLRLSEAPGKQPDEIGAVSIHHSEEEIYFHAAYARTMGKPEAEGYHLMARVVHTGGTVYAVDEERIDLTNTEGILIVMRLEYLDRADAADAGALRSSLAEIPADYGLLLERHAAVHREMFERVSLDLDSSATGTQCSSEELISAVRDDGPSAKWMELLFAVGRYAHVCGGTGELPVALSGIWGNAWAPAWDGRYTFDANINLAISGASQGNLPETMETYWDYIDRSLEDWSHNAEKLFGCRGVLPDLCQGWRHGLAIMLYPWVSGAGWLASYLYDHYLYTMDREFLRHKVIPILKSVALFYEDFLDGTEDDHGRVRFYPSLSPENSPAMDDTDQVSGVVLNATCDLAICREALGNVIEGCRELGIEADGVARWQTLLNKLPDYAVNEDGALAEWSYPGLRDRYNHRHSSHLYPLYPSLECSPERTPELFQAARRAVDMRLEAGLGNKSAHGILHILFVAARLRDPELAFRMLDDFGRLRFINSSMFSCHNPGLAIYNLDSTFTLPAVFMKLLVHSEIGSILLLPALPTDRFLSGTVRGLKLRGNVALELFHWNIRTHSFVIHLRSRTAQALMLGCRLKFRFMEPISHSVEELGLSGGRDGWRLELPADETVMLRGRT